MGDPWPPKCLGDQEGGLGNSRHAGNAGRPCGGYIARAILKAVEVTFVAMKRAYDYERRKGQRSAPTSYGRLDHSDRSPNSIYDQYT